ncbi:gliding motility-associated C-terminal domain-containing protein [Cytophaga hutchinsonii]|uniref:PKD domain-containing protein n=1 Tax=Cytophaga hutchinsonii (strain ATCC 33406 / DSM 1761 / CIP 103989 / NBRC 15051 / NCIMB 9469 / D465) TaxID=269798 RepID=A0A6N4SN78_CYTH3|nr:gliding motility-associated C-terminal domain-containing protein [Cytophaga hutchinsonii]ABG57748.1 conserved hypothetical protein; leucine-rich repeat (LRR) protein [Cytophaga hutchinsonii ATCC 33406]SFX04483.1 gliding motility-associated C-terminal domain-containing protein [Cytophaga hutchinsonii ATCC 33406]
MRHYLLFLFHIGILLSVSSPLHAQYVSIPDANFRAYLESRFPSCMQAGKMDTTCIDIITNKQIDVPSLAISNLSGIQYFDQLERLNCENNTLTFLPPLPVSLKDLSCGSNKLIVLPALPPSLLNLFCGINQLTSLPYLPMALENLACNDNKLTLLPDLPDSLIYLYCYNNQLQSLPRLPQSLTHIACLHNQLTTLPALPESLRYLRSEYNQLTSLPVLPSALYEINVDHNLLTVLPSLPQGLDNLSCSENPIEQLPLLPASLRYLTCRNSLLTSLPYLPYGLESLRCDRNKITILPNLPETLITLLCNQNAITCLPVLPDALTILVTDTLCRPNLPSNLKTNIPLTTPLCSALTFSHTRVCVGDSTSFELKDTNCYAFLWDFDDPVTGAQNTSTLQSPKHLFSKPGTFQVKLISYVSDPATVITQTVTVDKLPRIDFGNDHSMCPDENITLNAGDGFETYRWQDGSDAQIYAVKTAGTYTVTATNACGTVADAIHLSSYSLILPNLFTPNKDGYNETFEVKGTNGDYGSLEVYNAWGAQVFGAERYYNNWNGEGLSEGVYYYSFTLKNCPVQKGWVQIIRR